jgi:hypothetical protein
MRRRSGPREIRTRSLLAACQTVAPDPRHVKANQNKIISSSSSRRSHGVARGSKSCPIPSPSPSIINWQQFHTFLLQRMTQQTAKDRLRYAKKYAHILDGDGGNASELLQLAPGKRIHCMKASSCLAHFIGKYDTWLAIRQKYGLKWTSGNETLDTFERFFLDDSKTLDTMLQWLRQAIHQLPKSYSNFFLFCTLTGLRVSDCVACIKLVKDPEQFKTYYNESRQCLEHFRYKSSS